MRINLITFERLFIYDLCQYTNNVMAGMEMWNNRAILHEQGWVHCSYFVMVVNRKHKEEDVFLGRKVS